MKIRFAVLPALAAFALSCSDSPSTTSNAPTPSAGSAAAPAAQHRVTIDGKELTFQDQILYLIITLNIYRTHVGQYPSTQNNLDALISAPQILEGTGTWQGPYADNDQLFIDPWGRRLEYSVDDKGLIDLRSLGPDGIRGGDDLSARDMYPEVYKEMEKLAQQGPIPIPPLETPSPTPPQP